MIKCFRCFKSSVFALRTDYSTRDLQTLDYTYDRNDLRTSANRKVPGGLSGDTHLTALNR